MRKLLTSSIVLSFLSITSFAVNANDFTVQVGAYQVLTNQAISKAEKHGEVYQSIGNDNVTRLHVGRFTSKAAAESKRNQLRNSGYRDAFITQISVTSPASNHASASLHKKNKVNHQQADVTPGSYRSSSTSHSSTPHSSSSTNKYSATNKKYSNGGNLSGLSPDEKKKAAFLDGQLRIHSNGQFYTLEQYRRQNRQ